jgi:hypothetical protein
VQGGAGVDTWVLTQRGGDQAVESLARCFAATSGDQERVEKIRHRAYVLEKRGWLLRAKDGRFTPAPGTVGRAPTSAKRLRPGAGTA